MSEAEVAARAVEVERLALELEALKEKHNAGSRLEACLLELDQVRKSAAAAQAAARAKAGESGAAGARAEADAAAAAEAAEAETAAAARAAEVERLSHELVALKEKHNAGSRLEACLLELDHERRSRAAAEEELASLRAELASIRK